MKNEIRSQLSAKPSSTRIRGELADSRSAQQALEAPFARRVSTQVERTTRRTAQTRERTVNLWKKVGALGAVAVLGVFAAPKIAEEVAPSATGNTYTQTELGNMPQEKFQFAAGQGVDDAIVKVDGSKDIFSDGPDLTAVEDYVKNQAPNGVPQPNETVEVPVLPASGQ